MKKLNLITAILLMQVICIGQIINVPVDQPTIQAGINAAQAGDTVLVEDGEYYENIRFMGKAITLASRFIIDEDIDHIDNTIIDGSSATNPDSASTVMFIDGEDTTSIICGFTITGGSGMINATWASKFGGGIACWESGAKIIHNKIINNEIYDPMLNTGGAGIGTGMVEGNYWILVENNEISNNIVLAGSDYAYGGGVYVCLNGIIKNNTIENNYCYNTGTRAEGGGIEVEQFPGLFIEVAITNNIINNNELECHRSEGAGIMIYSAEVQVLNNIISNNYNTAEGYSLGAGIMCRYAENKITIAHNTISNNSGSLGENINVGSGICILEAYDVEFIIDANIISNNVAKHGGGFYERRSYNISFTNNIFRENSADIGGALSMFHQSSDLNYSNKGSKEFKPTIINNTFFGNVANDYAGAIRYEGIENNPIIVNSIFWENDAPDAQDIKNVNNAELSIHYCDINTENISGFWIGENNINVDPGFIDDICHLIETSQCIEAGITSIEISGDTYNCPDFDIDGQMRPLNGTADIGADEVLITRIKKPINKSNNPVSLNIYPNPISSATTIEVELLEDNFTSLDVYDITGKKIENLISGHQSNGNHLINWNVEELSEGIYFIKLSNKTENYIKRAIVIK